MRNRKEISSFDISMIQRCLELASKAAGKTSPNPLVGSVVVQDGKIVGEGFHPQAGEPHAEIFALRDAGKQSRGATLYVNLEPCSHYGQTPPCADALINSGVSKVVIGMVDPNPQVAGKGINKLKEAGIEVLVGVEEAACQKLNEAFVHRIKYQKPFGILKYAMTLDGKIATTTGHSTWVTGKDARKLVHLTRSTCDAVIVGGNTVRKDNPNLTTHGVAAHNPLRVVMSRNLDLPADCNLWRDNQAQTIIFTENDDTAQHQKLISEKNNIITVAALTPEIVLEHLYQKGISKVLWECGGTLAAKVIAAGAVQKIMAFIAPKIIGGVNAPSPVGDLNLLAMTEALNLDQVTVQQVGSDFLVEGYLK